MQSQKNVSGAKDKDPKKDPKKDAKKTEAEEEDKKRKKGDYEGFQVFINRTLKNMHPDIGITKNGMEVMNSFVKDLLDRFATEAATLCRYQKKETLSVSHVQGAIKLVLPPGIAEPCIKEGNEAIAAVEKYEREHPRDKKDN